MIDPANDTTNGHGHRTWPWIGLTVVLAVAAALRFGNIGAIGLSNTYYTAAVKAMLQSWSNFYFVAAEPGGSVSVDKPPLGLWLETGSAALLGVSGFAVVLPNLLAGLASIVVLFHLVRRSFGEWPALLAAFALAVTPVAIAVERNNTPDGVLVLTLLLAAWAFSKATETGRLRWLLSGVVWVGVGFNIKMLQAFLPLPAFYALYILGARVDWRRKLAHLGVATGVLLIASLAWPLSVDLTPADQRPYVGSSTANSEIELIVGYNGLQRLLGGGGPGQNAAPPGSNQPAVDGGRTPGGGPGPAFGGPQGGPQGGAFGTGRAGPLRLFQAGLAAQASWLLPFALWAVLVVSWTRQRGRAAATEPATVAHGLILWGGWLLTAATFFSVAGFFHPYYLTMLGAPIAALVAIGFARLWDARNARPVVATVWLVGGVAATLAYQAYAASMYGLAGAWLLVPIGVGVLGTLALAIRPANRAWARAGVGLLALALVIVPTVWSGLTTAFAQENGGLPQAYGGGADRDAGPRGAAQPGGAGPRQNVDAALLAYLETHSADVHYLLVVPSSQQGAAIVLATGRPVLYAGGFNGGDPVIDASKLAQRVAVGDVRYVLWSKGFDAGGAPGRNDTTEGIAAYLQGQCTVVSPATWGGTGATPTGRSGEPGTLYRCGTGPP